MKKQEYIIITLLTHYHINLLAHSVFSLPVAGDTAGFEIIQVSAVRTKFSCRLYVFILTFLHF